MEFTRQNQISKLSIILKTQNSQVNDFILTVFNIEYIFPHLHNTMHSAQLIALITNNLDSSKATLVSFCNLNLMIQA